MLRAISFNDFKGLAPYLESQYPLAVAPFWVPKPLTRNPNPRSLSALFGAVCTPLLGYVGILGSLNRP